MRYLALATDYDETLAVRGHLSDPAVAALRKLRRSGRRAFLLTGRTLDELRRDCPQLDLFDCIVAENGALLYVPCKRRETLLCPPTALALVPWLRRRGVEPLITGKALLATRRPHEATVLEGIRELGIELQIIFNGDAVMVLPSGINKGSGLKAALRHSGLSAHEVVGIGNAANDHSFLEICECAVAVDNAIESLKQKVDFCTRGGAGDGVIELIEELVDTDLSRRKPGGRGDVVVLATGQDGPITFSPYGQNLLISGPSGAGKSSVAAGVIERLIERSYQLCIIDPEGDYSTLDEIITVGHRLRAPSVAEVLELLADPDANLVVNLLGLHLDERPDFFAQLFPRIQAMRARHGRPHWVVIDEVHHLLPMPWGVAASTLPQRLGETVLVTHLPREVAPAILAMVDTVVAVGPSPGATLNEFSRALGVEPPELGPRELEARELLIWERTAARAPVTASVVRARSERLRHLRKYAEGNLGPNSFFFRGPDARLNLKAVNLVAFCDIADGVDDETWLFHLRNGDYTHWLRGVIKDDDLAREVAAIAESHELPATDSRRLVREAIDRRYVLLR